MMNLQRLASWTAVNDLVGKWPDRRWGRACLTTRRGDGYSIAGWFEDYTVEKRGRLVREAVLDRKRWSRLMRVYIAKKAGSPDFRSIDMPTVLDQAVLYLLHDWLVEHAEQVLTKVAVGFRRGVQMHQTVLNAYAAMKERPFVAVVDIASFFDTIGWGLIDRVIEALPADQDVQDLLKGLVRVEVVEKRSGSLLVRARGIPQGLSLSPILANLALNRFDRELVHTLSKFSSRSWRYCDDIPLLAPSCRTGEAAVRIVRDRLKCQGLTVKAGTGNVVDTRQEAAVWLGISFGPNGLNVSQLTIAAKVARLQGKLDQGVLGLTGIADSLVSLDQHYRRIIGPERSQEVVSSIKERLDLSAVPPTRKAGIDRLGQLVAGRHHRGHMSPGAHPQGKPDDVDGYEIVRSARAIGRKPGAARIRQW